MQTPIKPQLDKRLHFPFSEGGLAASTDRPPTHNQHLKNFISNRREQPAWAVERSSSTIPVFRSMRLSTLPGASSLTFSPTTKARKASGSSGNGRLSAKRDRRKERKEKSKQVTEHGAVSLAAPFLIWPVPPLPHLGSGKAADRKTFWTLFRLGNTISFGCAETHF